MQLRSRRLAATLVPQAPDLWLDHLDTTDTTICVALTSTANTASCPRCGQSAWRIRSRYSRTLADLPWSGLAVKLLLLVRKFACDTPSCPQRIFTERLPTVTQPYARRTNRLTEVLRLIAFATGGEGGSRLLSRLRMQVSAPTLLRLIRATPLASSSTPRFLGIDDWARRKGHTYGTILVDLEQRRPVDLLPDREAASIAAWLKAHPGIEIISRDRAGVYADGATTGAPDAIQVADRWHLLGNLRAALERALQPHTTLIKQAVAPPLGPPVTLDQLPPLRGQSPAHARTQQCRTARLERYTTVHTLRHQGLSLRMIAQRVGLNRKTVQRFVHAPVFPERQARPPRPSRLDPYKPYVIARWNDGCHNGVQLRREIAAQGYDGGRSILSDFLAQLRQQGHQSDGAEENRAPQQIEQAPQRAPSLRQLTYLVLRRPETLTEPEQEIVAQLRTAHPEVEQAMQFTREFAAMVRQRQPEQLEAWLWRVANSEVPGLRSFAAGIQRDKAAVIAGLGLEWSQGPVEGHITRVKLLKRAMYGRANPDLLRQRVLYAA